MSKNYFILLIILMISKPTLSAEVIQSFKVSKTNANLQQIANSFEIKERLEKDFLVYVLEEKVKDLKKLAPQAVLINKDINSELKKKSFSNTQKSLFNVEGPIKNRYHSFDEVKSLYYKFSKDYPNKAKIITYGQSEKGRELFALKISDPVEKLKVKPKLMITSATHGDELITVEVQLRLVEELLRKSDSNLRYKKMVQDYEIYFIPVVNPDGFSRKSRYTSHRVDPNRAYPWPNKPHKEVKVPCIKKLIEFYHEHDFNGSMDIHARGKMVMFPWAYTFDQIISSDYNLMYKLTKLMAKDNGYKYGPISKVIYIAKGSSSDYYYWKNKGIALAIELTTSKYPRPKRIPSVVDESREMMWTFVESF